MESKCISDIVFVPIKRKVIISCLFCLCRKALSFEVDRNKQCNLAICLMQMNKVTEARFLLQAVTAATKNRKMDDSFVKSYGRATQMLQEMESTAPPVDLVKDKGDNKFNETQRFSGRNMSSPYSTPNLESSNGKTTDTVKSRTEDNRSLTSDAKGSHHSHARRRLYESLDPAKSDPKVPPYTKPKRPSWGFNSHSDSKPSFVSYPNEKAPYIIKPNLTQNGFSPCTDTNWRTRTLEGDAAIVKYGPTTTVKEGNTTAVFGSGSIHPLNTEAAMKFTKNDNNKSHTKLDVTNEFTASVDTKDQNQGSVKFPY